MGSLLGRCTNEMFCTLGASGRLVQVPDDSAFVCPLCGKTLVSPSTPRRNRLLSATLFSAGVAVAVSGAFLGGMLLAVITVWTRPPTVTVLATEPIAAPPAVRHYAFLQTPAPQVVKASRRHR